MASALLVSRNEPYWGEQKVYMRKNPNSNPNPNPRLYPNPSQSANPNPSQIFNEHASSRQNQVLAMESDEPVATVAISDDSSSFNHRRDPGGYVTYNISTYTKKELRELKRRLVSELEQVRSVTSRIEARELQTSARSAGYSTSGVYGGGREVTSAAVLPSFTGSEAKKLLAGMMKKCGQILSKLMKHKGAVWFNIPVDVVGMGLHDYHLIIKTPMDLGTVRSKLSKGAYPSPVEFASDIRLTFENALVYNPQGHEVHRFAEQLLRHFEGLFGPPYAKYEKQQGALLREEEEHQRRMQQRALETAMRVESVPLVSSPPPPPPPPIQTPVQPKPPLPPPPPMVVQPQPQAQSQPSNNNVHAHVQQQQKQQARRLPKPKARDPDKRGMTTEEKEKLSVALHNLPEDKSNHVLHIIKKRNVGMLVDGDVVEIDFEMMDNETLWELDRFVVNWEKAVKKKRVEDNVGVNPTPDSLMVNASVAPPLSVPCEAGDKSPVVADETLESLAAKKSKKGGDPVDEDVDIGDEMPATNYPSIEIEKDAGYESSSSSSGSDSSTSSDSDSGSSSGSDSDDDDGDDAQPPAASSRPSPRS